MVGELLSALHLDSVEWSEATPLFSNLRESPSSFLQKSDSQDPTLKHRSSPPLASNLTSVHTSVPTLLVARLGGAGQNNCMLSTIDCED